MEKLMMAGYTIGVDAYGDIKNICPLYGSKIAVIGGKKALYAAENAILRAVEEAELEVIGVFECSEGDSNETIRQLHAQIREADMLFAVGGGRAIDTCKVLAHEAELPFFTFPTVASTCAACTGLGVLCNEENVPEAYSFSEIPPNHIFINTQIIADAPSTYLWAGMGGALAKHYERFLFARGHQARHSGAMGLALNPMCAEPILRCGVKALLDCMAHQISDELTEVILACIVSTGYVSNFAQVREQVCLSHGIYHGFQNLPAAKEQRYLHGAAAVYGILLLLTIDQQYEERDKLYRFCRSVGLPCCLEEVHISAEACCQVIRAAIDRIDTPFQITDEMIMDGILELEEHRRSTDDEAEKTEEELFV